MTDLAKLVVKMEADTARYQRDLDKAQKVNQKFASKTKSSLAAVKASYFAMAAGVVGAFASIRSGIERQADLADLSTRLGATTEGLSRLQYAAEQSGVSVQTLNMGLQRMVRRVAEAANGTGEARGALEELNIAASDLNKLKPEQQFSVLADAIMKVENPADRVRLAMKLFDSEGVSLIQTMQGGSQQLAAFGAEADKLGLTVGTDAAQSAKRASDAFTRLSGVFTGASNTLASQFAPEIELAANFLAENLPKATLFVRKAFGNLQRSAIAVVDAFVRLRIRFNEFTGDLEEADSLRATSAILQQMGKDIAAQNAMLEVGGSSVDAYGERVAQASYSLEQFTANANAAAESATAIDAVASSTERLAKASEDIPDFWKEAQESFEVTQKAIDESANSTTSPVEKLLGAGGVESIFSDLENIEDRFKQMLANMLAEALVVDITNAIFGRSSGGGIGDIFGSLFGGARAKGGPVAAGTGYLVGEEGPEFFMPNTSGSIIPNHQMGGATINMTVVTKDADSFMRSKPQIEVDLAKSLRRAGRNM